MQRSVATLVRARIQQLGEQDFSSDKEEVLYLKAEIEELHTSLTKGKEEINYLNLEMDRKLEQMRIAFLEFEDLRKEHTRLEEESQHFRDERAREINQKDSLINEYQRTMTEQRTIIEKKQLRIAKLEAQVNDLTYEVRSLLQLDVSPLDAKHLPHLLSKERERLPDTREPNLYDLSTHLHRYISLAENLTGMDHLGYVDGKSPRFLDTSLDSYAVDRRRLFDSFGDETSGVVFIYSLHEEKFLFVNQYVKTLLGWSPEKFIKEFPHLLVSGLSSWKNAIAKVKTGKEHRMKLMIKSRSGNEKSFYCVMGTIQKGPFTNHLVGLFC